MSDPIVQRLKRRNYLAAAAFLKYLPTPTAMRLRNWIYRQLLLTMGKDSNITDGVTIINPENIELGDRVSVHEYCVLDGSGGIRIGDNVAIANSCAIISSQHIFDDVRIPIKDQGLSFAPVKIGNNVWLGSHVTVVSGVSIGDGCVIGAGSVVTRDVPSYSIAAGVPCRVIKSRLQSVEEMSS